MEKFIQTIGYTNFRPQPTTNCTPIKSLTPGTVVQVLPEEVDGTWYKGKLEDGTVGYVTSLTWYVEDFIPDWLVTEMEIVRCGNAYLGVPYVFGSSRSTDVSFDCSDFQQWIYGKNGIKLPWDSRQQSLSGEPVDLNELMSGDLVFFAYDNGYIHHVSQYVNIEGKDRLLHTFSTTSDIYDMNLVKIKDNCGGVTWSDFSPGSYWRNRATLARRVISRA